MSDSKTLVEMVRGQRDADELLPMTSYVVQPIYEPTLAVPVTTDLRTQNNDVTAQPVSIDGNIVSVLFPFKSPMFQPLNIPTL